MIKYRPILFVVGVLLSILAIIMLIPAMVDLLSHSSEWTGFFMSAFLTSFVGISLIFTTKGQGAFSLNLRQTFVLTTVSWLTVVSFGALPFLFSNLKLSYTDSFFETMSGITTTGASILTKLDTLPPGILLWRSILAAIGGIGIIVFAIAILPMLRIGGMQLFKTESADKAEKIMPRMTQASVAIIGIYASLAAICAISFRVAGMTEFDAINHALSVISTAGFSTHDQGFAFFDSAPIDWVATIFMFLSGLPFVMYMQIVRGDKGAIWRDEQVKWYVRILLGAITIAVFWLYFVRGVHFVPALRHAAFNITSIMTTSGFADDDYSQWGNFFNVFIFMLSVMGGCTGSTTGGIKIFRFQILFQTAKAQLQQLIQPHAVVKMRYNGKAISDVVTSSVMSFIILYGFAFITVALILAATGLDFISSMSASASCISNVGPGLGALVGPMGNYSSLSEVAKWTLAFAMLLGRLEIFTILVLLSPKFWKD